MLPDAIENAARILWSARLGQELIDDLPDACRPRSLDEAYRIQDRLFELLGDDAGGWLVGCTNPSIQAQLGLPGPYAARVLMSSLFESPASLCLPSTLPIVLEVEFAFTLARDLPSRATPYSPDEVASAVHSVHPAIEVVLGHLVEWPSKDIYSLIADNGTDGPLVYGAGTTDLQSVDLNTVAVVLRVNGKAVRKGRGSDVMEGPLSVLTWLANQDERPPGLRAGQIINTGSCTSMYPAQLGDVATADFGPLGEATVEL
jgi:2-keto-4-pentenoate hydratase